MPFSDFVPHMGDGNLWTRYTNVLGVPIRKRMVIAVVSVFALFFVFVCAFVLSKSGTSTPSSQVAHRLTSYVPISSAMDLSVDPCTDFYEFTCGQWVKSQAIDNDTDGRVTAYGLVKDYYKSEMKSIIENADVSDELPDVVNDAIKFFQACGSGDSDNEADLRYLKSYFEEVLGEWPMFHESDDSLFDWRKASALLVKTLGVKTLFDLYYISDDLNTSQRILYLKTPDVTDLSPDHHSATPVILYSLFSALDSFDQEDAYDVIDNITNSKAQWVKLFSDLPTKSPPSQKQRISFRGLNSLIPDMDWLFYFRIVMSDTLSKLNTDIMDDDIVLIDNFQAIKNAVAFFSSGVLSSKETANLFGWLAVKKFWFLIPGVFQKYSEMFSYSPQEVLAGRKASCFDALFEIYSSSVDFLLVRNSSHSSLPVGREIVDYLKSALQTRLNASHWLDDATKEYAKTKLDAMQSVIGFKSYLDNKTEFENVYSDHPRLKPSLLQTYVEIFRYFVTRLVSALKSDPKSAHLMVRSVGGVGAYYNVQKNVFTLPLSIFNPPFYYGLGPAYLNFGALGSIVGHEIMHGFDSNGCKRGKTGTLKEWWTPEAYEEYARRSQCFTERYAAHLDLPFTPDVKLRVTNQTRDEDIADNEGVRSSFLAYQQWVRDHKPERMYELANHKLTPLQMFFVSYGSLWCAKMEADVAKNVLKEWHSIPKLRVNGVVSNSKHFSEAFRCPIGSPMNPEEKCELW